MVGSAVRRLDLDAVELGQEGMCRVLWSGVDSDGRKLDVGTEEVGGRRMLMGSVEMGTVLVQRGVNRK